MIHALEIVIKAAFLTIALAVGSAIGILLAAFLLLGCGGGVGVDEEVDGGVDGGLDAGGDSDSDSDSDTDSDTDSDSDTCAGCVGPFDVCTDVGVCDEETGDYCTGPDTWSPSCPNGTCDCGEDPGSCPLDCPPRLPSWTECMPIPEATAVTCDEICADRGETCRDDVCGAEEDGVPNGAEGCGGVAVGATGPCGISWSFDEAASLRCCCEREG